MEKGLFCTILIVVICTLIMLGVATLPYYTDIEPQYLSISNAAYDFTGTFETATGFFTKIGNVGRDVLEKVGILKPTQYKLYITTYTDGNDNYAYLVTYQTTVRTIKQGAFGIITWEQYYDRIYAYSDYSYASTFSTYIETIGCKYEGTGATFAKNDKWTNLCIKKTIDNQPTFESNGLSQAPYTYTLVSVDEFNMNMIETYNLKKVK